MEKTVILKMYGFAPSSGQLCVLVLHEWSLTAEAAPFMQ